MLSSHLGFFFRMFSSVAVGCVLTLVALIALVLSGSQDSKAEGVVSLANNAVNASNSGPSAASSNSGAVRLGGSGALAAVLPMRPVSRPNWDSRIRYGVGDQRSPLKGNFGVSKLAFPLLVSDLLSADQQGKPVVMSGPAVGVR